MHIHTVFFWLKACGDDDRLAFEKGLARLIKIESISQAWWGPPAGVDRDVVDGTYSYSLTVVFDSRADHDHYQEVAEHQVFVDNHHHIWDRVQVYDTQSQ